MSLHMMIGSSGSGKTELLYRDLIRRSMEQEETDFFLIVPEQSTMQAQKEIVRLHPRHGTMNIDIVSFQRLAYRIFSELSMPQPEVLDDIGKTMVLRKIAETKKKELSLFSSHLSQTGFLDEIKSMISEFYQYAVTPDMLTDQMNSGDTGRMLKQKLSDLNILYREFQAFIKDRYITMEEILDRLCDVVPLSSLLKDSVIVLDGYTGFTPVQYRLIGFLLQCAREVTVTITAPYTEDLMAEGRETDLFDMSRKMAQKLAKIAEEREIPVTRQLVGKERPLPRFRKAPALDFLERNLFRYPYRTYGACAPEIRLLEASNPQDEISSVINRIQWLVKKEGYRYRDIGIVLGDPDGYKRELVHQFESAGIPLFFDAKDDIAGNPLIRLIRSSLEMVQKNFDYESVFRYLRSGLVTEDVEETDRFEIYVRSLGLRGLSRYQEEFTRIPEDYPSVNLVKMNEFRETFVKTAAAFKEAAGGSSLTVRERTEALYALLTELHAAEQMHERSLSFKEKGMYREAREYEEIYDLVSDLADRLCSLLGDETVSLKEYKEILEAGFAEIRVGMIPACADRIVAGDLKRTRMEQIRALFFLGVNEGLVPSDTGKGGIFTGQEREFLKQHDLVLAPTAREEGFMQRFYLYLTLMSPSSEITVSWSELSAEGKTLRPSILVGQLRKRFPENPVLLTSEEKKNGISIQSARDAVIRGLSEPELFARDQEAPFLYQFLAKEGGLSEEMKNLEEAASYTYRENSIGRDTAKALYGDILRGSVTRMEQYASCEYAHFLKYGLSLHPMKEYEIDLSDMGNLFHRSLDVFFARAKEKNLDLRELSDEVRSSMVKDVVAEVSMDYRNTIMSSTARNLYLQNKVERITEKTVRALVYQLKKGEFVPEAFEVDIDTRIPVSETESLNLRGRIDRLDVCEDGDKVYVKIMDYKSGSKAFDLSLLYHGLQIQLVVYMDAALRMEEQKHPGKAVVPAGLFYYHIDDPVPDKEEGMTKEMAEAAALKKLRMNGLVNSDLDVISRIDREIQKESDVIPVAMKNGLLEENKSSVASEKRFRILTSYVRDQLVKMGQEILNGEIAVNPYKEGQKTACDYCPYHSVCGFDQKIAGHSFRKFRAAKPAEIWEMISPEEDEEEGEENGSGNVDGRTETGH